MATYSIDGIDYEIDDSLDLKKTVDQIRALPEHQQAGKSFFQSPDTGAVGADRSLDQLAQDVAKDGNPLESLVGGAEFVGQGITGLGALAAGGLRGIVNLPNGLDAAQKAAEETAHKYTYQPRTDTGQLFGAGFSKGVEKLKEGARFLGEADFLRPEGQEPDEALMRGQAARGSAAEFAVDAIINTLPVVGGARAIAKGRERSGLEQRLQRIQEEQRLAQEEQYNKMSGPYQPTIVEKVLTAKDRNQAAAGPSPEGTLATTRMPIELETPEQQSARLQPKEGTPEGINFPLRQEVLDSPKVREITDAWRDTYEWMKKNATKEELAQFEKGFAEEMAKYGVRNAQDAHGLNRPLYEGEAKALPVERSQGLQDHATKGSWSDHTPTPFELADLPKSEPLGVSSAGPRGRQRGQVDPRVFLPDFKFARDALIKTGEKLKIIGMNVRAAADISHLPEKIQTYINEHTFWDKPSVDRKMKAGGNTKSTNPQMLRVVAIDANGKPRGYAEFRGRGKDEIFLESDSTHTKARFRKQGIQNAIYDAVRAEGADIRPSSALLPGGKTMWNEGFAKKATRFDEDGRPILERTDIGKRKLPKKQKGSITPFAQSFSKFKADIKKNFGDKFSDEVIQALYDEETGKKPRPVETEYSGNAKTAVAKIPGMKLVIGDLVPNLKPVEELMPAFKEAQDIPGDLVAKGARQIMSGSKVVARFYNHPLIKAYADHVSVMQDAIRKNVDRILFSKEEGVVDHFDKLSNKEQVSLWKVIRDNEGKRDLTAQDLANAGLNEKQVKVYENLRKATDFIIKEINAVRAALKQPEIKVRPGYFPAKFIGDWYVTVKAATGEGKQNLIGLYSANNKWSINKLVKRLKEDHPDWDVSDIIERRPYSKKKGSEHAFNVYGDLLRVIEDSDPRAEVLKGIIEEYQNEQANYTAGLFQHLKNKKGIEGASGKNQYRTELQNSHDAFKAFTDYVTQAMEYVETKKVQPTVSKLLDRKSIDHLPNAQEYISQHWDRTRGINNAFAQALNDVVFSVAHGLGISGGAVKSGLSATKSQIMFMLLGYWNPRFLIAQMLQPSQFLAQNISSLQARGLKGGVGEMAEAWAKGLYHMYKGGVGREHMEPHARKALEWAEENRVVEPRMFEDIKTDMEKYRDTAFGWVNGQKAIRWTEEKARTQTYLTFVELVNKAGIKGEEAYQMAADMTRHTMVDYRPFEKPLMYQNLGIVGDMISPLTTFKHNYYSQMAVAVKELARSGFDPKYAAPVVIMLAMQGLLSGLMGVPGREDVDMVMSWLKKLYPNTPDLTQVILQSKLPNYVTHGVSTVTGMDMSPTFAPASLIPDRSSEFASLPSKAVDMVGAAGKAAIDQTRSSAMAAAQQWTPNSLQGLLETQMTEGDVVQNPKNKMKGAVRRDTTDWVARALSMRSIDESREKTMMYKEQVDKQNLTAKKAKIVEKAADAVKNGQPIDSYAKEAMEYGMTPKELMSSIKELWKDRTLPESERFAGTPPKSYNQYLKYKRLQGYRNGKYD